MGIDQLSLNNIARGAAPEIFDNELRRVLANISDPNCAAGEKRSIVLEFVFKPLEDRSGTEVTIRSKSKLAAVSAIKASAFLIRKGEQTFAYPFDPRQTLLFEPTSDQKQ